jgi:nitronate monooxygenase
MMLTELLGIRVPLIQAPMAGVQGSALAIAVIKAGGLGSLPAAMLDETGLRDELIRIRAATTSPYNVNFFCHQPLPTNAQQQARWRQALAPYYQELGLAADAVTRSASRSPFGVAQAEILAEFAPPVVSFHFGLPDERLMARVKEQGSRILASATTVAEARWLEARGVDAIIAQGLEAGGHRGHFLSEDLSLQQGTFSLLPQIVEAVSLPVIAAGGIADAKGIRAAMALGASGVQLGTAFLCCHEATTSPLHRMALRSDGGSHTALTRLFSGRPARGIVNRLMRELGPLSELAPPFPHASSALAPLRAAAEQLDRGDFSPLWAGQNITGCHEMAAADLVQQLSVAFRD